MIGVGGGGVGGMHSFFFYQYFFEKVIHIFQKFQNFIHMHVIHILRNLDFYPYLDIHIFQILKNLSIFCYPYGYIWIKFLKSRLYILKNSNFLYRYVYRFIHISTILKILTISSLSIFLESFLIYAYRVILMHMDKIGF